MGWGGGQGVPLMIIRFGTNLKYTCVVGGNILILLFGLPDIHYLV